MNLLFRLPLSVNQQRDAVKLLKMVKDAEIKFYGIQVSSDEAILRRIENVLSDCKLPLKKSEQLILEI